MEELLIVIGFCGLLYLQKEIYEQEIKSAFEEGYKKGLYEQVVKISSKD